MAYCPNCGSETEEAKYCPNCGAPQQVYVSTRHQYDEIVCLLLCCFLTPIASLIYLLLTKHPGDQYVNQFKNSEE